MIFQDQDDDLTTTDENMDEDSGDDAMGSDDDLDDDLGDDTDDEAAEGDEEAEVE